MDSIDNLHDRMEDYDEGEQGCWSWIVKPIFTFMAGFATAMVFVAVVS